MGEGTPTSGIDRYFQSIQSLQTRVITSQQVSLNRVAAQMADTIRGDRRIFIFGTGHSHLLVEEAFYRAGGLAAVVPILSGMLMLHEGIELSAILERTAGLAGPLLDSYQPQPGEMLFVFSNSGVNRMPVEVALEAKSRGLFVVSVSSLAYARVAPLSTLGKRLDEVVDIALDNGGEPGDALVPIQGTDWRAGPSSTVVGALLWNALVVETAERLQASGVEPPVIVSINIPGAAEHNAVLLEKWRRGNRHL